MSTTFEREDAAGRYDSARALPPETAALWMRCLRDALPPDYSPTLVLDLGAGTGRFAAVLQTEFRCPVVAVEPSPSMLAEGRSRAFEGVTWRRGKTENIPLEDNSVDLVWMSQAFHHLDNHATALEEIRRVLRPNGYLAIRNSTKENNAEIEWLRCFPETKDIDNARFLTQARLVALVSDHGFESVATQTIYQYFASSYAEYYDKIARRGLSALIAISDEAFEAGLRRLRDWVDQQAPDEPVNEPVDLFVFRVRK